MVAKYARHIRRLTVRSLDAFRLFEAHCTELTAFHCRFEPRRVGGRWVYWHSTLAVSEMQQAHRDVHAFAVRQTKLDSINYTSGLMDPAVVRAWLVASSSGSRWRHLDVYLDEDDYRDIVQLLPNVHSARFAMADLTVLYDLLPEPHLHLRELQLWAPRLDHQALVGILTSFPRLQRLVVRCDIEAQPPLIDLTIDHGSMLYVGPDGCPPGDIGRLLAAVAPPLLILDYADRDFRATLEAVAEHCQELLYFECSAGSRTGPYVPLHGSTRLGASRRSNALMGGGAGLHQPELIRA
ncbi:hypothetical protein DFQ27_005916 [Actinomortierella ambigua]|uniref:Uncharacterized protein n=1 Tax=Actinomortierella ambigua TaxID=1343610 RepID=A0A9P6PZA2_9FUNG|nr:hypothetical protein DFQ27_005916 [Actinomortierella ambigua]